MKNPSVNGLSANHRTYDIIHSFNPSQANKKARVLCQDWGQDSIRYWAFFRPGPSSHVGYPVELHSKTKRWAEKSFFSKFLNLNFDEINFRSVKNSTNSVSTVQSMFRVSEHAWRKKRKYKHGQPLFIQMLVLLVSTFKDTVG